MRHRKCPALRHAQCTKVVCCVSTWRPRYWRRLLCVAMSDCDSEDYSSSDDEDYVPSGGEYSEDDVHELEKEDDDDDDEQEDGEDKKPSKSKTKKKTKSITARKRKKGVLVLNTEEGVEKHEDEAQNLEEANDLDLNEEKKQKLEEARKKHEDDLWSSFLFDVGPKPKPQMAATTTESAQIQPQKSKESAKPALKSLETNEEAKKVTITKVFDFAGEEVRVTKEVDSTSREAREFVKQQEKGEPETSPLPSRTSAPAGSGVKRTGGTGGLGSILGKLGGKKQKLSTLEKSKMDWNSFKEKEGISEELAIHNRGKDGYIERKAFLERVDYRQFELEREIRLKNMKPA